jgi:chemotaxis protein MotA
MYLIGIIVFLVLTTLLMTISAPPMVFLDFPSLLVILGVTVPILLASGLLPDLGKGFRLMTAKENPFSLFELKRIRQACHLTQRVLPLAGVLGTLVGLVGLLTHLDDPTKIGPAVAMSLLTFIYAVVMLFVILPIRAKTDTIIDTMEEAD